MNNFKELRNSLINNDIDLFNQIKNTFANIEVSNNDIDLSSKLYDYYCDISSLYFEKFKIKSDIEVDKKYILENLQKNKVSLLKNDEFNINLVKALWEDGEFLKELNYVCDNSIPFINKRVIRDNFSYYEGSNTVGSGGPTQIHINKFSENMINSLKTYLLESNLKFVFEKLYKTNIGVANIRCWRYFNGEPINVHKDSGLLKNMIKIMIFRDTIDETNGCFEINGLKVLGDNPSCIIDTKFHSHWAKSPNVDTTRDVIEVTLASRIEDDFLVSFGGWQSGFPLNPFKNWRGKKI